MLLLSKGEASAIEVTRWQAASLRWHNELRRRVTATLAKSAVCHRSKDFTSIVQQKLSHSFHGNKRTHYGQQNEVAVENYKVFMILHTSKPVHVEDSSLSVRVSQPWLAALPDEVVSDPKL